MAKKAQASQIRWQVSIIRGKKGRMLGIIRAPDDEAAAREVAIEEFGITDARDLLGLALQRMREA